MVQVNWSPGASAIIGSYHFYSKVFKYSTGTEYFDDDFWPSAFTVLPSPVADVRLVSVSPDRAVYRHGDSINLSIAIRNNSSETLYGVYLDATLRGPDGANVGGACSTSFDVPGSSDYSTLLSVWTMPESALSGAYKPLICLRNAMGHVLSSYSVEGTGGTVPLVPAGDFPRLDHLIIKSQLHFEQNNPGSVLPVVQTLSTKGLKRLSVLLKLDDGRLDLYDWHLPGRVLFNGSSASPSAQNPLLYDLRTVLASAAQQTGTQVSPWIPTFGDHALVQDHPDWELLPRISQNEIFADATIEQVSDYERTLVSECVSGFSEPPSRVYIDHFRFTSMPLQHPFAGPGSIAAFAEAVRAALPSQIEVAGYMFLPGDAWWSGQDYSLLEPHLDIFSPMLYWQAGKLPSGEDVATTARGWVVSSLDAIGDELGEALLTSRVVPTISATNGVVFSDTSESHLTKLQWDEVQVNVLGAMADLGIAYYDCFLWGNWLSAAPSNGLWADWACELQNLGDDTKPTITISTPTGGQAFTTLPIAVGGAASDPGSPSSGVALVEVRVNSGSWQPVAGTETWSMSGVVLSAGGNMIEAQSKDNAGNRSSIASVEVTYNPPGGSLQFKSSTYPVAESGGSVRIYVSRTGGSSGTATVNYATADGAAHAGSDYAARSGTLSWSDGNAEDKYLDVPIVNDGDLEGDEAFTATLSGATGASVGSPATTTVTITDDESPSPGTLQFKSAAYSVAENGLSVRISVSRIGGSSGAASVNYATADGTAYAGGDYTAISGTLNWSDGDVQDKYFNVVVIDDAVEEGNEAFTATLAGPVGATLGTPNSANVVINDNDGTGVDCDFDDDGDVDQEDYALVQVCLGATGTSQLEPGCEAAHIDSDTDVDQQDVLLFLQCMSGPNNEALPECIGSGNNPETLVVDLGNGVTMDLALVHAGTFEMGDTLNGPIHSVMITQPFYMGHFEVTQAQWQAIMGTNPSRFVAPNRPVERVSWNDAQAFCHAVSVLTGRIARLPTEAEWEYACRAGTMTAYFFGDSSASLESYAWFNANSSGSTHEVGLRLPNSWGLHDMAGNVYEICQDWYGPYSAEAQVDPVGPLSGTARVNRGGSWYHSADALTSASRNGNGPSIALYDIGFRLVVEAD